MNRIYKISDDYTRGYWIDWVSEKSDRCHLFSGKELIMNKEFLNNPDNATELSEEDVFVEMM